MRALYGAEQVCLHFIDALLEENIDVALLTDAKNIETLGKSIGINNLNKVKKIEYIHKDIGINKFLLYQRIIWKEIIKRWISLGDFKRPEMEILTLDSLFLFNVGVKKIAYIHYPDFYIHKLYSNQKIKKLWNLYYAPSKYYSRNQIKNIDLLFCNSEFTKLAIQKTWNRDAEVVYPPVDIKNIKPNIKENYVVTVGRFSREKNYEMVINIAKMMPNLKFLIIGGKQDENYYNKIRQFKPKNVILLTDLPKFKINSIISKAKVYLHTMINEHFGISIVEAMAAGCIPIVHNSGGPKEIVGNLGFIYSDPLECKKYIEKAMRESFDLKKIIERAQEFSSEKFKKKIKYILKKRDVFNIYL
jgi:glycosyltransferase involved in cell wall biosynthesis